MAQKLLTWIKDRVEDFRDRSAFFQLKVGLIFAWLVISVLTVVVAVPKTAPWDLKTGKTSWGAGQRTFIDLKNADAGLHYDLSIVVTGNSEDLMGDVRVGRWSAKVAKLPDGETLRIWPRDLSNPDGERPASEFEVTRVVVKDDDDDAIFTWPMP